MTSFSSVKSSDVSGESCFGFSRILSMQYRSDILMQGSFGMQIELMVQFSKSFLVLR